MLHTYTYGGLFVSSHGVWNDSIHESVMEYLLCDCGPILVDPVSDSREGISVVEELLDDASVLERKMLVLQCCHFLQPPE